MRVELTDGGYLVIPAAVAEACFGPAPSVQVAVRDGELWALSLGGGAVGGLILKRRNRAGDRAVLVVEQLRELEWDPGERVATWDGAERALRVPLVAGTAVGAAGVDEGGGDDAPRRRPR